MAGFGALSDLADENRRVLAIIENEFESLSPEDAVTPRNTILTLRASVLAGGHPSFRLHAKPPASS